MASRLAIKICGLTRSDAVDAALEAGADMIGLMFFDKSPRHLEPARAVALAAPARGRAAIVAITVNMDDAGLRQIVDEVRPDLIQLHGGETPERAGAIADRFGVGVMKALGAGTAEDVARARAYRGRVERILFDAKPPEDASRPGGLGQRFDWSLLDRLDLDVPFMLSGGLDAGNVAEAVHETAAIGVDVSSGVEARPGIKDPDLIRAFVAAARNAEDARGQASLCGRG